MSSDTEESKIQIFISYGHEDELAVTLAHKISGFLEENGYKTWLDSKNGVPYGTEFNIRIEIGIKESSIFLALLSRWSLRDEGFCRNEILFAKFLNKPIMPVRIENREPPLEIIALNFLDCSKNPDEILTLLPEAIQKLKTAKNLGYRAFDEIEASGWWVALQPLSFDEELANHGGPLRGREWIIRKIGDWAKYPDSRMLLVTAHAGVGKSAIAAHLQSRMKVRGIHFCSYSNVRSCSPGIWLGNIIFQLASQFRVYRENIRALDKPELSHPDPSFFRIYVTDPLFKCRTLEKTEEPWVFVIDGLDEAMAKNGSEFLDFLVEASERIPPWMRIIVFSRPGKDCENRLMLKHVDHFLLASDDPSNKEDLELYIKSRIIIPSPVGDHTETECPKEICCSRQKEIIQQILSRSEGNFLYAGLLLDEVLNPDPKIRITLKEIGQLPLKITGMYNLMFSHRFGDLEDYRRYIRPIFLPLVIAREPLPDILLRPVSDLGTDFEDSMSRVSEFLTGGSEGRALFHTSLSEWLTDADHQGGFYVNPSDGHRVLANACLSALKNHISGSQPYILRNLPFHLTEACMFEETGKVLADPVFLEPAWEESEFSVKSALALFEQRSGIGAREVYLQIIKYPENYSFTYLSAVAQILMDVGFLEDSIHLLRNLVTDAENDGDDIELQKTLGRLSWVLYLKGEIKDAQETSLKQQEICTRIGDDDGLQRAFHYLGNILLDQGEYGKALDYYRKGGEICERINNRYWKQKSLGNQGLVWYHWGNLDKALTLLTQQDEICQEIGHIEGRVKSLGNRGNIFYVRGDFDESLSYYLQQENLAKTIGYQRGIMYALGNQGLVFLGKKEYRKAYERFRDQRRLSEKMGSKEGLQTALGNLGLFEQERGRFVQAETNFKEELRICREIDNKDGEQAALGRLANVSLLQGDQEKAHELYGQQEGICRNLSKPDWLQGCLGNQGVMLMDEEKYDLAYSLFSEQEKICRQLPNLDGLRRCLNNKGLLFIKMGKIDDGIACFEEELNLCKTLKDERGIKQALDWLIRSYVQKGDAEKALGLLERKYCDNR